MAGITFNFTLIRPDGCMLDCYVQAVDRQHALERVTRNPVCLRFLKKRRPLQQFSKRAAHQKDWPLGTLVIGKAQTFLI